ncbi:lycopene cyclase [Flavobacterium sp. D11R37]|uniref:lycopene cyclase family protein n=1 Tax=Flavobacterium coralii TaxID=2838017 RepID=UPI001CA706D6|nr:lycopene cyclase family protein [Flavobacterium coralii]MBY8963999.1 lycopene cyclase [Flavobacterium coralii]
MTQQHFDFIFAGGGLATLMTLQRMVQSGSFTGKSILVIEPDSNKGNDRTWCFWEPGSGEWDGLLSKQWDYALFADAGFSNRMQLAPYRYKMLRSADFYGSVRGLIKQNSDVTIVKDSVTAFTDNGSIVTVTTALSTYTCNKLFNSIYKPEMVQKSKYPLLQQHFIGWFVKTDKPVFDSGCVTFMDFSIPQRGNTRFMYVLPLSETEALIEYTLFSKDLLPIAEYEDAIKDYLTNMVSHYTITETEKGNIPMTCYPFWEENTKNIINIGSAGGWTKASTGYTFKNTTKKSRELISFMQKHNDFRKLGSRNRFWFYDLLLLDILYKTNEIGSTIFSAMFRKVRPQLIFKFLDEETTFAEELKVIWACPKMPFIKALLRNLF